MIWPFAFSPVPWVVLLIIGALLILRGTRLADTVDILVRLLMIALPVGLVFLAPISFVVDAGPIQEPLRQGLLAALVVVAGWIVTFLFQELGRRQDQTDLMLALRAEIFVIREQVDPDQTRDYLAGVRSDFSAARLAGKDHRQFVTMPPDPTVFEGVVAQITRLPSETVDEVIQFYSLLSDMRVFVSDLRSADFAALPMDRRELALCDYVETRVALADIADTALKSLNEAIGLGAIGLGAIGLGKLNGPFSAGARSRASVRSDRKSDGAALESRS